MKKKKKICKSDFLSQQQRYCTKFNILKFCNKINYKLSLSFQQVTDFFLCFKTALVIGSIKTGFQDFMKVRSLTELNLSWANPGALIKKRYFESGSESHQAVFTTLTFTPSILFCRILPSVHLRGVLSSLLIYYTHFQYLSV